jgi:hypothetical protein
MGMMMPETRWDTNKYIIFSAAGWLFIHLQIICSNTLFEAPQNVTLFLWQSLYEHRRPAVLALYT